MKEHWIIVVIVLLNSACLQWSKNVNIPFLFEPYVQKYQKQTTNYFFTSIWQLFICSGYCQLNLSFATGPYNLLIWSLTYFISQINAAGLRYRSLLKQWTTHVTLTPSFVIQSDAYFNVRGFYGDYDVILQLPNGLNSTHTFTLDPGNGPLNVEIDLPGICSFKQTHV